MIPFGSRIEMMVDRYLIEKEEGLRFCQTAPENRGKVLSFEKEWEGAGSLALTALDDGETVKLYYRGFPTGGADYDPYQTACLAVSEDGVHFTRFPVNEINYKGITENNIVFMGGDGHNFAPFYDTNPACEPDRRYKAIGGTYYFGGIRGYSSPDGVHWKPVSHGPVITSQKFAFDSMNMAFWDPAAGLYRCYLRAYSGKEMLREIWSCTSEDFRHWSPVTPNEYAAPPCEDLYTNAARPVPGAEHILISIPMRFQEDRLKVPDYPVKGVSDAVLMTSRDGVHWDRTVRDAWIRGGLYEHEWTQRCFITAGGIIERGGDFYFYVGKNYMWPDGGIYAYSVPKYRFLSLYADADGGFFETKPLRFEADEFYLNYATSAYGYVKIKAFGEDGTELFDSGELFGNELSRRLFCEGLKGKTGFLRAELKEADLYALGAKML